MKKRIRIKDIAAQAGVSSGTVDRILHNRGNVSEKARAAVEKVLNQVGYKPNIHLSGLSLKKTYEIVIHTPCLHEYWEAIHNGIRSDRPARNIYQPHSPTTSTTSTLSERLHAILIMEPDAVIIGPHLKMRPSTSQEIVG